MSIKREWATPITIGAFLLSAVTGVLLFFHLDSGLNKLAHEWLSWVLLAAVAFDVYNKRQGKPSIIGLLMRRGGPAIQAENPVTIEAKNEGAIATPEKN